MPLSWNEIKDRAVSFSREWADETSENAEAKSFWDAFFNVFGVPRRRVATFEQPIKKSDGQGGFIDLLWKGILLVEHKSRGKSLDRAFQQAKDYFPGLKDRDLPRYILVSDFASFRLYDLEDATETEFLLKDLYQNIRLFGFISGYQTKSYKEQDAVNIEAAERMGALHDRLKAIGYTGHVLEVYLVRLLFCLFADDTSIFQRRQFQDFIEQRTAEDGQDLGERLGTLFENLNIPQDQRLKTLDEQIADFPYVNGSLFAQHLPTAAFDRGMRDTLLECCALDWSKISPAIFGALFQSVMDEKRRRNLGAHYTTEENILKLIGPLFLDELRAEFEEIKRSPKKLQEFHKRIAQLKFLDPACGCGNFLVIAYRELRLLEIDILRILLKDTDPSLDVVTFNILCDVDQFYGIEIEEFPAQIAQTALWLMDHQMNMRVSEEFGNYFVRLPLRKSATIVHDNALRIDWRSLIKPSELNFILGNPPFGGKQHQSPEQKQDLARVFNGAAGAGIVDFVAPWYRKATDFMKDNAAIRTAYVSTNSITQGEQVGVLWPEMLRCGVKIFFAHRTFQWSSEAPGKAAVHCVIIGFSLCDTPHKLLFDYDTPLSEAHEVRVKNINPYLVDAEDAFLPSRSTSISGAPEITFGNMPNDGGFLLLNDSEKRNLLKEEPLARKYVFPFFSAREFINNEKRWCLWLVGIEPEELRSLPHVKARVAGVKEHREKSDRKTTQDLARFPTLFGETRQPDTNYILIPRHFSENRNYITCGFLKKSDIVADSCLAIRNARLFHFGVLSSAMHMSWVRSVCGRIKSDYRYSARIVYNNFPWPQSVSKPHLSAIEDASRSVLEARQMHPNASLADLYDPLSMPPELVIAHQRLDEAVDAAYSRRKFSGDRDRMAFLFGLYQQQVAPLTTTKAKTKTRRETTTG